ncbi:MAG: hypothetical protein ACP5HQ_07600 [Thermoprotei archaeon]
MRLDNRAKKAVWFLGGLLAGVGYIAGIFYVMIARKGPERWLGLLYFAGPLGSLLIYFLTRKSDRDLKDMALYLLYGFIAWVVIALALGVNPFYQVFAYVHGWLGV